ncbi:MAG TPA: DUF5317 family protein [Chloroflexota bacterium]|nr:DUF5317 family protein [Chloroflexota bacterium]
MIIVAATALGLALAVARWHWSVNAAGAGSTGNHRAAQTVRWWPIAAASVAVQLYLVGDHALTLPSGWRLAALWATNVALAGVLTTNLGFPGMRWLLAGMALNFAVMAANGGLMPVSSETLVRGGHGAALARTGVGAPLRRSKDVLLPEAETRLALLSDRIVAPPLRGSFSVGDGLIGLGIVLALNGAAAAAPRMVRKERRTAAWSTVGVT